MIESNTAARARRVARSPWFPVLIGLLLGVALMLTLAALSGGVAGTDGSETATKDSTAKGGPLSVLGTIYEIVNTVLTLAVLGSGPLLLFPRVRSALARRGRMGLARLAHRVFGWSLVGLFVIDLILITGPGALQSLVEQANVGLVAVLALTSVLLFTKPWQRWPWGYLLTRNLHVITAVVYMVKFFGEPLSGGKVG